MSYLARVQTAHRAVKFTPSIFQAPSLGRRFYANEPNKDNDPQSAQRDSGGTKDAPNHPIPSNKAEPTLREGSKSPLADFEGNLKDDVPEDVHKHNEDVENRYDRPFNHISDKGNVETTWNRK